MELPRDFDAERSVVIVAFQRRQQELVDSWVPWLEEQATADPGLRFYELPTIARIWAPARPFIDGGMAAAIRVPAVLQRTLTVYGDVRRLTGPLGITDRSTITILVVDRAGSVRWSGLGAFRPEVAASLREALDSC